MSNPLYRGYSTMNNKKNTSLYDIALVKQDLLNHFNTRKNERVGRPGYGSIIWDLLFDLGDNNTETMIMYDVNRIIALDPRVEALSVVPTIDLDNHTISVVVKLLYLELQIMDTMTINFNS